MSEVSEALENLTKTESTLWLGRLLNVANVAQLRKSLQDLNPGIVPSLLNQIVIVGSADEGLRLLKICQANNIKVLAICDENPAKIGQKCDNLEVVSLNSLAESQFDKNTPVILATHRVLKPYNKVKGFGFTNVAPFALLEVLDPVLFPPHMFYERWLEDLVENKHKIAKVAKVLADDFSRKVLDAVIGYRMTLNPTILEPIIEWELYGPNALLKYTDDEVYIDGGTFDGDSIKLFINRVNNKFDRIIGFEPDTNTFKLLAANFAGEPRVEPVNKGLYSHDTVLKFDNAGTRGSILSENAADDCISVPVTSIDEYLKGSRVSYIKMNIEGAEIAALNGAKQSIAQYSPKLGISIYHRASDIWEIPEVVQALNSNYKLYFRQHDGGVIESVLYALVD